MNARRAWILRMTIASVVFLTLFVNTAMAADKEERLPPYDVDGMEHGKIWVPWIAAFLFAAGILALAFKNPHRSNLERQ